MKISNLNHIQLFLLVLLLGAMQAASGAGVFEKADTLGQRPIDRVTKFLTRGDRAYGSKSSLKSFEQSLIQYDSAYAVATSSRDSMLLAYVYFAYARVYDGWNKAPLKTIEYFAATDKLMNQFGAPLETKQYVRYLLAHSYEKNHDSLNACTILIKLLDDIISRPDSLQNQTALAEMALASTEVNNYGLANVILQRITKPEKLKNNAATYPFYDHYILTKARIDVYHLNVKTSRWMDSLVAVFSRAGSTFDSMYYSFELATLYEKQGLYKESVKFIKANHNLYKQTNDESGIEAMQNKLLGSELALEKSKTEFENFYHRTTNSIIWILIVLLSVISILSVVLYQNRRSIRAQAEQLLQTNSDLEIQNSQNKLLTLEVHHRTKNNLQMILSLLQMQERTLESEEARKHLQQARARIETIAELHEHLLNHNHHISIESYVSSLIDAVVDSYHGDRKIAANLSIAPIRLPAKAELPVALILNEWITNSIKYALHTTELLQINLKIYHENGSIFIHYWDNGADKMKIESEDGFGTKIIMLLIKQLKAQLVTSSHSKYNYLLKIPNAYRN